MNEKEEMDMETRAMLETVFVDFLKGWAGRKSLVSITDGDTTVQCVINNKAKEKPKRGK